MDPTEPSPREARSRDQKEEARADESRRHLAHLFDRTDERTKLGVDRLQFVFIGRGEEPGFGDLCNPFLLIDPSDHATLRGIAETTDGGYFAALTEDDLKEVYDSLASRLGLVKERQKITFAFAGAGALLAVAAAVLGFTWSWRIP